MSQADDLTTRANSICAELALITTSKTSHSIDGHSMQHDQHRESLIRELGAINDILGALDGGEIISFVG